MRSKGLLSAIPQHLYLDKMHVNTMESQVPDICQGTSRGTRGGTDQEDLAQLPFLLQLVIVTQHVQPLIFSQACHLEHPIHHPAVAPCFNPAHHHIHSLPASVALLSTVCLTHAVLQQFIMQWRQSMTDAVSLLSSASLFMNLIVSLQQPV